MMLGIRTILAITFLVATGAPLAIFWFWPHSSALDNKVAEVHERHLLLARNLGSALETYHRDLNAAFQSFAPEIAAGRGDVAREIFENLYFRHICVADRQTGKITVSYLDDEVPCPEQVPESLFTMFLEISESTGAGMSGVMIPGGGEPRIYVVRRVDDAIVVGAIRTTFFIQLQKSISFGRLGHAAIVDQHGRAIAHPLDDWARSAKDLSKVSAVRRMLAGESGVETFFSPALKGDMIAGFTAVRGPGWGVMVPQPIIELEEVADAINRDAFTVFAIGLLLSAAIAWFVSSQIADRLYGIQSATMRMASGDAHARVAPRRSLVRISELANLRRSFNLMADQLESARSELIDRSYRSGHAEVAASTLHNLRNAMNPLINRVAEARELLVHAPGSKMSIALDELAELDTTDERRDKLIRYCTLSAAEIEAWRGRLADTLDVTSSQFTRIKEILVAEEQYANEPPVITRLRLRTIVEEALSLVPLDRREDVCITIDPSIDRSPEVEASRLLLLQVIQNLITNAIEAIERTEDSVRTVTITCTPEHAGNAQMIRIIVQDTGVGLEHTQLEAIFASGYTTKSDGRGGLGLHWCANTVKRMQGKIFAESDGPGQGASLNVLLPAAA